MGETETNEAATDQHQGEPGTPPKQRWRVKDVHGEAYVFDVDAANMKGSVLELVSDGQILGLFATWSCMVRVG